MITCLSLGASLDVTYVVESLALGQIHRPSNTLKLPGGKGLNVARAATRLGEQVRAISVLGGSTGQLIQRLIEQEAIASEVIWTRAETRSCVTIASLDDGRLTEIYEQPTPVDPAAQSRVESALDDIASGTWLVFSGSVHADIDLTSLSGSLLRARERGVLLAVDTHGEALRRLVDEVSPEIVKVNRSEAAEFLGQPAATPSELAAAIRVRTGGVVVVTDGADGAAAVGEAGAVSCGPVSVAGPYPVGSGDCFMAGLVTAVARGCSLERAMAVASACASANASVPGAAVFDPEPALRELAD